MSNSEKILKSLSSLIENGILTSKDIRKGISTDWKFKKDKIINKNVVCIICGGNNDEQRMPEINKRAKTWMINNPSC